MDWQKKMNQAMDYIENNPTSRIEYTSAAKFVSCSEWEFRRMFSFLVQMPLSEYVRRRRLTESITDIQNGEKIIDIIGGFTLILRAGLKVSFEEFFGMKMI